jgi:hypothetical protein
VALQRLRAVARRAVPWTLCFFAGCALALPLAVLAGVRTLDAFERPFPTVEPDLVLTQLALLERFARSDGRPERRVAFLGDSTAGHAPDPPRGIDRRLEAELAALAPSGAPFRVVSFAMPTFTPFDYYFLSPRVADADAEVVVLAFNLAAFSKQWRTTDKPERAALLPLYALPAALTLPLDWIGVSLDRLLLYPTLVRLGLLDPWRRSVRQQARFASAWSDLGNRLEERSRSYTTLSIYLASRARAVLPGERPRETAETVHLRLDALLSGAGAEHPVLRVLAANLELFRSRGIRALVYVPPVNLEHMESLGIHERARLASGVERVRDVVLAAGAGFLDLHDALQDADFRDSGGHLTASDAHDGHGKVARRVAQALVEVAGDAR